MKTLKIILSGVVLSVVISLAWAQISVDTIPTTQITSSVVTGVYGDEVGFEWIVDNKTQTGCSIDFLIETYGLTGVESSPPIASVIFYVNSWTSKSFWTTGTINLESWTDEEVGVLYSGVLNCGENQYDFNDSVFVTKYVAFEEFVPSNSAESLDIVVEVSHVSGYDYAISGSALNIDLTISNTGNVPITGWVSCALPTTNVLTPRLNASNVWRWTAGNTIDYTGQIVVAPNGTEELRLPVTVNRASWTSFPVECKFFEGTNTAVTLGTGVDYILPVPDLVIEKTLGTHPSKSGDVVNYTLVIKNIGSAPATGYDLRDSISQPGFFLFPAVWNMMSGTTALPHTQYGYALSISYYEWINSFVELAPGATLTLTTSLAVDSSVMTVGNCATNTAKIFGLEKEYSTGNNSSSVEACIRTADFGVVVTAIGDAPERLYDPVVFMIEYVNRGNMTGMTTDLQAWISADVFGPSGNGAYLLASSLAGTISGNGPSGWMMDWNVGPWAPLSMGGQTGTIIVTGYLNDDNYSPGRPICLTGSFWSEYAETMSNLVLNNTGVACHYVTGEIANLHIQKDLLTNLSNIEKGDEVAYRLTYSNRGNFDASGVAVTDQMPSALSGFVVPADCSVNGQIISCNVANELVAGASGSVIITGVLQVASEQSLQIINTGSVTHDGREYMTGDNMTGRVDTIPGLPDLWVTKTLVSAQPAVPGDVVKYLVSYGNSGGRAASGVWILDHIFSGLNVLQQQTNLVFSNYDAANFTGRWNLNTLGAWQTGYIEVSATVNDRYAAGTDMPNEVWIYADSTLVSTGNDYAKAIATVQSRQEVSLLLDIENLIHLDPLRNNNPVWAVSGDVVELTLTYYNSGNVNLNGVNINMISFGGVNNSRNIGNLPLGSGGVIVMTGVVGPQGFSPIDVTAYIRAEQFGTNYADIATGRIIEKPMWCGDGFMTHNEMCDTVNGQTIGIVLPGQQCQSRAGNPAYGCEVVTTSVVNTGCIDYSYLMGGNPVTAGYCVHVTTPVAGATCQSLAKIDQVQNTSTGRDVTLSCLGKNTTSTTMMAIDCGNGESVTGFASPAGFLQGVCSYDVQDGEVTDYTAKCSVGTDTTNPACSLPVSVYPVDQAICKSLDPIASNVVVLKNNEEGDLSFVCSASSGFADTISVDCGNGQVITQHDVQSVIATCDYEGDGSEKVYNVECRVNEHTDDFCRQPAIVTPPYLNDCGDGKMQGYEQCDLGEGVVTIGNYLDGAGAIRAGKYAGGSYYCENCAIKTKDATMYQPPACFNVNTNISVMQGEFLPFYWNLEMNDAKTYGDADAQEGDECNKEGAINTKTMQCTFALYNGDENNQAQRDEITTFRLPCDEDQRDKDNLYRYFSDRYKQNNDFYYSLKFDSPGKYVIEIDGDKFDPDNYGEHKLVLEQVSYNYCKSTPDGLVRSEGQLIDRVCEVNYVVTKPYLVQKSAFGAWKTNSEVDLSKFYDIAGNNILDKTDLREIMAIEAGEFGPDQGMTKMIADFQSKYEKIAVALSTPDIKAFGIKESGLEKVSKVPGKNIFVFEGKGKLVLNQDTGKFPGVPYTVIVRGMDLYIEDSVTTNGMFVVDGKIGFQTENIQDFCSAPQEVNGIFIAKGGFNTEDQAYDGQDLLRDNKGAYLCQYGNLVVNGVLIGDGLEKLVETRRSHLNDWFNIESFDTAEEERREKLFDGAAVLIEYNPSLWSQLPPGAEDFTKVLDVYKK